MWWLSQVFERISFLLVGAACGFSIKLLLFHIANVMPKKGPGNISLIMTYLVHGFVYYQHYSAPCCVYILYVNVLYACGVIQFQYTILWPINVWCTQGNAHRGGLTRQTAQKQTDNLKQTGIDTLNVESLYPLIAYTNAIVQRWKDKSHTNADMYINMHRREDVFFSMNIHFLSHAK